MKTCGVCLREGDGPDWRTFDDHGPPPRKEAWVCPQCVARTQLGVPFTIRRWTKT